MVTKENAEALKEVNVILSNLSNDILKRIPNNIIEYFKINEDKEYNFVYDKTKLLFEQNLKPETKGIIAYLYKEYVCDEIQKKEFERIYSDYTMQKEQDKVSFNPEALFQEKYNIPKTAEVLPSEMINNKWYTKILNVIKKIFIK